MAACKCPPALGLDSRHAPFPEGVHVVVVSRDGTSTELQLRALPCGCLDPSAFEGKELDKHDIIFSVKKIIKEAITAQGGDVPRGRASVGTLLQAYKVACETSSEEEASSSEEEDESDEDDSDTSSEEDSAASNDKKKTKTSRKNKDKVPSPARVKRRKIQAGVSTPLQPAASSSSSSNDPKDVISQQWLLDLAKTLSNYIWIQGPDADGTLHEQVQNLMEQRASTIEVYINANIQSMKRSFVEKSGVAGSVITKAVAIKLMEGIDNQALLDNILVEVYNVLGSKILENIAVLRHRWTSAAPAAQPTPAGN